MYKEQLKCPYCEAELTAKTGKKTLFCPCCGEKLYSEKNPLYKSQEYKRIREKSELVKLDDGTYCTKAYLEYEKSIQRYKKNHRIWMIALMISFVCTAIVFVLSLGMNEHVDTSEFEEEPTGQWEYIVYVAPKACALITAVIGFGGSLGLSDPEEQYFVTDTVRWIEAEADAEEKA